MGWARLAANGSFGIGRGGEGSAGKMAPVHGPHLSGAPEGQRQLSLQPSPGSTRLGVPRKSLAPPTPLTLHRRPGECPERVLVRVQTL